MLPPFTRRRNIGTIAATLAVGLAALAGTVLTAQPQRVERAPEGRAPAAGVGAAEGWQLLVHDGCQFAVPPSWRATTDGEGARAPDGSNLSVRRFRMLDWALHKAHIREAFVHLKIVHEDSDRRFWFEIGDQHSPMHYIAVRDGVSVCIGLIEMHVSGTAPAEGTVNRIVASVGPAAAR